MRTRLFSLILALVAVLLPARMWADGETPWAAVYTNGTDYVLHFTYSSSVPDDYVTIDGKPYVHVNDETWYWDVTDTDNGINPDDFINNDERKPDLEFAPGWYSTYARIITKAVIDHSFIDARPQSCAFWFAGYQDRENKTWHSNLHSIEGLEYLNTSQVVNMWSMFQSAFNLTTIDVSHFDTSRCQYMAAMFNRCYELKGLNLSSFNTASVKSFYCMFQRCYKLTSLDVSTFDTTNATNIQSMFNNCKALSFVNVSNFNTTNITNMQGIFQGTNLTTIDISNWNVSNVTYCPLLFKDSPSLKTIYVNETWKNIKARNANLFTNDTNLVGGKGTKYNAAHTHWQYACIDDPDNNQPGYLTNIADVVIPTITLDAETDNSALITEDHSTYADISINCNLSSDAWQTICLPFEMLKAEIAAVFGTGTEIKQFSNTSYLSGTFTPEFQNVNYIEAGKPYLIKPTQTVTSFTLRKAITAVTPSSITAGGLTMTGTFSPATVTPTEAYWNLYTPTSADYATLVQDADNSESVNGFQAYFTSINGTEYTLKVSSAGAATLYLPFNAQIPEDADYFIAAGLKEIDDIADNASIGRLRMIKQGIIPANTGVVILANPGSYTLRATEEETEETAAAATSENYSLLSGTLEATNTQALREANPGHTIYTLSRGTQQNFGFKPSVTGKVAVAQYRAYLAIATPAGAPVRDISLTFGDAELDEATGINEVNLNVEKASDGIYYNLNGQRVTVPTKGIYIKDGKKVYVK